MTRRYGSGTVYPLKARDPKTGEMVPTGRFGGQWSAGRDEYGSRIRRTVTAETEAAAWKAMADARGKSSSTKRRRGGETVAAFLDRWLADVVRTNRRERTYWGYRSIVLLHLVPTFGERELRSLTRRDVQAWVGRQKGSPLSVRHRVDCLRAALSYAVRWNLIDANPATDLDLPSVPTRAVRAMEPADARKILAATAETSFARLVAVALYTGLRQGELLGLRWADVDMKAGTLTVHASLARLPGVHGIRYVLTEPKSAHSRRTVPLAAPAWEALREQQKAQMAGAGTWKGLVFAETDRPIDGTRLTKDFQAALEAAELPDMRWHDLRHATASLLIADGHSLAVVSSILGHSGIGITVDVYGHLAEGTKRAALDHMAAEVAAAT